MFLSNGVEFYQHIPEYINPVAISIGSFSIRWYSLMYLVGFIVVYGLLKYRLSEISSAKIQSSSDLFDLLIYLIIGLLLGARLGYVLFYNFSYYFHNPLEIFLPARIASFGLQVTGIYGMSFFGGLVGVLLGGYLYSRRNKINFWQLAEFIIPAIPAGYFFGRIGNFLNGELYGRITDVPWGMYFPADPLVLRHPSQLYEAFFEGIVLFCILWSLRNNKKLTANPSLLAIFLFGYGLFRFFLEFFREPDLLRLGSLSGSNFQNGLISNWLTLGQIFSLALVFLAIFFWARKTGKA